MPIASESALCNMALGRIGVNAFVQDFRTGADAASQACAVFYDQCRDGLFSSYAWSWSKRRTRLTSFVGAAWDSGATYATNDMAMYNGIVYAYIPATSGNSIGAPNGAAAVWRQVTRDGWAFASPLADDVINPIQIWPAPANVGVALLNSYQIPPSNPIRTPLSQQRVPFAVEDSNDGTGLLLLLSDIQDPVLEYSAQITSTLQFTPCFIDTLAWSLASELANALRADPKVALSCAQQFKRTFSESIAEDMRYQREDYEPNSEFEQSRES